MEKELLPAYNDFPITDMAKEALSRMEECSNHGLTMDVFQKWTCSHCNARQTMEEKNVFFTSGKCEECNQVSKIENCNYLMTIHGSNK